MWSYMKFGPVVQEEVLLKEKVYGWSDDGGMDKDRSQQLTLSLRLRWAKKGTYIEIVQISLLLK